MNGKKTGVIAALLVSAITLLAGSCNWGTVPVTFTSANGGTIYDSVSGGRTYNDFPLTVSQSGSAYGIVSVTVKGLTHTYAGDLTFSIVDPAGEAYALMNQKGGSADFDGDYIFSDSGNASLLISGGTVTPGNYLAATAMSDMANGVGLNGAWKLRITDNTASDTGSITGWSMVLNCTK